MKNCVEVCVVLTQCALLYISLSSLEGDQEDIKFIGYTERSWWCGPCSLIRPCMLGGRKLFFKVFHLNEINATNSRALNFGAFLGGGTWKFGGRPLCSFGNPGLESQPRH